MATFEIFTRKKPGIDFIHSGTVVAENEQDALAKAKSTLVKAAPGYSIWVVPAAAIMTSDPDDSDAFFDPAEDKYFRHARHYELPDGIAHM